LTPTSYTRTQQATCLRCVFLNDSIFGALALQAFAEMIRKAFGKNYRSQEIDFQVGDVLV